MKKEFTMIDLTTKLDGVKRTKACKVRQDRDETVSKTVHVTVDFAGGTVDDLIEKAMSSIIIAYQSSARKKFNDLVNNQNVTIQFKAPSRIQIDPEQAFGARLDAMTPEARQAKIAELKEKYGLA
jgi:hypothetical protein